nr:hypothetical protein Itr_chr12CG12540 [Ipomoea trifida]
MLIKTTKLQSLIFSLLFFSYLAAHCNGLRREFADKDADAALAKYEKCLDLCDPLEGQRIEYMCRQKCKETYEEETAEKGRRSPPSGGEEEESHHGSHGRLEECWKECEDRDEGIQTKFCKKSCETAYGSGRGRGDGGRGPV